MPRDSGAASSSTRSPSTSRRAATGLADEDVTAVRNVLDRLGEPDEIADDARHRLGLQRRGRPGEIFALIGLLVGGFVFVIGWFVGLALLWVSDAWTTREKLVGTLVVPGGLLPAAFVLFLGGFGGYSRAAAATSDPATGAESSRLHRTLPRSPRASSGSRSLPSASSARSSRPPSSRAG